ncbi:glutathione S-transferase family protein [Thalassotalea agarivorans]|uniref:Glutathione S-transferase n=1 Tax=Thalassotalea agarivorans TaxID=349064 RepID=A0A1I0FW39_THASX|nr:glutathione S-transferase family protein [Thalassotalea agarivorans]SET61689.1 glutathione S-transferase [Thalassotalea agarivorans]
MLTLIGSGPSPYVRRIRILLGQFDYKFVNLDIYGDQQDIEVLKQNNPANKIPVLKDEDLTLYDSRVIYRYLGEKFAIAPLSWPQENLLTLVDATIDSLIVLIYGKRSGYDVESDVMIFQRQQERLPQLFAALDKACAEGKFDNWDYPAICLYTLLDWSLFRELYKWQTFEHLQKFYQSSLSEAFVSDTDPRL